MITLEIPELTPSLNELLKEYRNHRSWKAEQEKWNWLIRQAMKRGDMGAMVEACEIIIHRFSPRGLDYDNMGGGCKQLLDGLRHNELIVDDNPKVVTSLTLRQPKVHKKESRTLVEIIPLMVES